MKSKMNDMKKQASKSFTNLSKSMTNASKSLTNLPKKMTKGSVPKNQVEGSSSDLGRLGASFDAQSVTSRTSTSSLESVSTTASDRRPTRVGSPSKLPQASEAGDPSRPPSSSSFASSVAFASNPDQAAVRAAKEREATGPYRTNNKNVSAFFGVPESGSKADKGKAPARATTRPSSVASSASSDYGQVRGFQLDKNPTVRLSKDDLPQAKPAEASGTASKLAPKASASTVSLTKKESGAGKLLRKARSFISGQASADVPPVPPLPENLRKPVVGADRPNVRGMLAGSKKGLDTRGREAMPSGNKGRKTVAKIEKGKGRDAGPSQG